MRKLLTILFFLISIKGFTQYPTNQSIGADSTLVTSKGGLKGRLVNWSFSDTTDANLQRIKYYPGAQIFTTTDTLLWFRSPLGNKWIQFFTNSGGSGGDTLVWKLSGNSVATRSVAPVLGTLTSDNLNFITYGVQRMIIPATGIVRNTAAVNKYLLLDTITKNLYYGDGGGSGSTPTWQQTLTAGSILNTSNVIDGDGNDLEFGNNGTFNAYSVNGLNQTRFFNNGTYSQINAGSTSVGNYSDIFVLKDSIKINPNNGVFIIDTLVSQTSNNTLMGWTSTSGANRGKVGSVAIGTGLQFSPAGTLSVNTAAITPTWQQTLTAGSTLTGSNTIDGGNANLIFNNTSNFNVVANLGIGLKYATNACAFCSDEVVPQAGMYSKDQTRYFKVGNTFHVIGGLANLSTQNRLIGQYSSNETAGYVTIGTGLSLSSGMLSNTVTASSPAGNYGNIQLNRNGAFATPGSDSLDFESATGLSVKGSVNISDGQYLKIGGSNILNYSSGTNNASFAGAYNFLFNNGGNVFFGNTNQTYFSQGTGDLYFSSGTSKLGIGTTTPSQILHVNGTGQFGTAGTTIGKINISGNTSGTITIQPQAAAGTYNFNLPNSAGSTGYLLTSGGGGSSAMTWTDPSSFGFWKLSATSVIASDVFIDKNGNELTLGNSSPSQLYLRNSLSSIGDPEIIGNGTIVEVDDANQKVVIPNGNVGVGTASPTGKLDVQLGGGNLIVDQITGNHLLYINGTNGDFTIGDLAADFGGIGIEVSQSAAYIGMNSENGQFSVGDVSSNYNGTIFNLIDNAQKFTFLNGNVGIGTSSPTSTLTNNGSFAGKYTATATGITLDGTNYVVNVTATGQTITLPDAAGIEGRIYTIKLTASGSCTVATTSSQTIDASTTYSLASQYKYVTVQSDNANWIVIGNN